MNTEQLIATLAAHPVTAPPARALWRLGGSAALGGGAGLVLLLATLGANPQLAQQAAVLPMVWIKLAFTVATAAAALAGLAPLALPGRVLGPKRWLPALPALLVGLLALQVLGATTPAKWPSLWLGSTWWICPILITAFSVPAFVLLVAALRSLAPTRLRGAGAMAGLLAGAVGATVYQLHCPELAAPFLVTWYVLGMLVPAALGALVGPRVLRW